MNEEYRDAQEVLMIIKKAIMFADPIMKLSSIGIAKLIQFFARMVKEKIIDKRDFSDFHDFIKRTNGNFDVINIPVENKIRFGPDANVIREFAGLKEKGVRFFEMPDLNKNDNYVQIAVCKDDKELFSAWYGMYLKSRMSGGEKTAESLDAFTEGRSSIFSLPFEGNEIIFKDDFEALKINYSILPDLKIGDGQIQIMVANRDVSKLEHWYKLYQNDRLEQGEQIPDINLIDMNTYQKTAEMSTEEYMNSGDEKVQDANQKYEKEHSPVQKIQLADDEKGYEDYESDQMYQKFTINKDTLVEPLKENIPERFSEFFVSRVPGTYGKDTRYLVIPKYQIFVSEDSSTYTAFFEKDKKPIMFDSQLKLIASEKRPYAKELFDKHYDLSEKERMATDFAQYKAEKAAGKMLTQRAIKAPNPPIK